MKYALIGLVAIILSGCDSEPTDATNRFNLPKELSDCKIFYVSNLTIVRCPNSSTATTHLQGKVQTTTVVIDGKEYVEKETN